MNFDADDLDWALGVLLHLIWQAKMAGVLVHQYAPQQFFSCMQVINAQPFVVRQRVIEIIRGMEPTVLFFQGP